MALYLSKLSFQNIRGFKDFSLDFDQSRKFRQWTIFIGDNGHGKTTILRAIAVGVGDEITSSELLALLPGQFIRINKKGTQPQSSYITVVLKDWNTKKDINIETELKLDGHGGVTVNKKVSDSNFKWGDVFICGYGSNRGTGGRMHSSYALRNALLSLFKDTAGLLEPESILRDFALMAAQKKKSEADPLKEVKNYLWSLWRMNPNHTLNVTPEGVIIHGAWGGMPFHSLGDGYRGTGSWLLDLMGNSIKAGRWKTEEKLSGIVLLDEMDEHLHPKWQKTLVTTLRRLFPNIQFITTTHSPLAIVNAKYGEVYATRLHNSVSELIPEPLQATDGFSANEILMGEWFGLSSTLDSSSERLMAQYKKAFDADDKPQMSKLEPEIRKRVKSFIPYFLTASEDPELSTPKGIKERSVTVKNAAKSYLNRIKNK